MKNLSLAVLTALVMTAPAFAADPPAQTPPAKATPANKTGTADDPNKQICERRHVVGSNIESKVCMTKAEWDEARRQAQAMQQEHLDKGVSANQH